MVDVQAALYTVRFVLAPITVWLFFILAIGSRDRTRSLHIFVAFLTYLVLASYFGTVAMGFYPFSRISVFIAFIPTIVLIPLAVSRHDVRRTLFVLFTIENVVLLLTLSVNLVRSLLDLGLPVTVALLVLVTVPIFLFARRALVEPLCFTIEHIQGHWIAVNAIPLLIGALTTGLSVYGDVRFHDEPFLATGISLAFEIVYLTFLVMLYHNLRDISELSAQLRTDDLVRMQVSATQRQLQLLEAQEREGRIEAHDRRHRDNMVIELLNQGETRRALQILEAPPRVRPLQRYCVNPTVNAVVGLFAERLAEHGVAFEARLDIPEDLPCDVIDLSIVVSNLLENALDACLGATGAERGGARQADGEASAGDVSRAPFVRFSATYDDRLLLEIENPVYGKVRFDDDGLPVASAEGHGIGTRSVAAFAQRDNALVDYHLEDGVFRVRVIV